ncbi:hypothetical protein AMECASPLE_038613 [Ameca splendens]|uniref:Uncharacterized protein n=1 Tax=Ameca splendens TaxID=208324 RepID=A0ABV0ZI99_9TELE
MYFVHSASTRGETVPSACCCQQNVLKFLLIVAKLPSLSIIVSVAIKKQESTRISAELINADFEAGASFLLDTLGVHLYVKLTSLWSMTDWRPGGSLVVPTHLDQGLSSKVTAWVR